MIKLKNLISEDKDQFGNEYIEHGNAYALVDTQTVIFWKTKNMYDITKANDVKFIKKLSSKEMSEYKGTQYLKDAGIIKEPKTKKLRWEY